MKDNITQIISDLIIQILIIFGFYILFHGKVAPGGGFQAGAIFAVSLIFYHMIHGNRQFEDKIGNKILDWGMALGILIYAGIGLLSLFLGKNYLNYSSLFNDFHLGQKFGIMGIEIGVAFTVASVFTKIYIELSEKS